MAHGAARPRTKYGGGPLLMTSLMAAVYTDASALVSGCRECLELAAENLDGDNEYMGHCLHCRQEITAQGGVEWRAASDPPRDP